MKALLILLILTCCCAGEVFFARVTYYTGNKTASGKTPVQGVTVAAAKKLKFGTKLSIPELASIVGGNGTFVVQDRGPAVEKRTASNGKMPVIDVYVNSRSMVKKLARNKKQIFKITVK